ncbi:hypothetical protein ES703_114314 [subsurface metagenome]
MKNHPLYKKLKQKALNGNYTIEQVRNLDFNTTAELLETRSFSGTFLKGMKLLLIAEMQDREDEANKQLLQSRLEVLRNRFPNFEVERGRIDGKPFVTFWLNGKPEIE